MPLGCGCRKIVYDPVNLVALMDTALKFLKLLDGIGLRAELSTGHGNFHVQLKQNDTVKSGDSKTNQGGRNEHFEI